MIPIVKKYTRGPWQAIGCEIVDSESRLIATVNNAANAQLIAAAPDIIGALQGLLYDLEDIIEDSTGVVGLTDQVTLWDNLLTGHLGWSIDTDRANAAIRKALDDEQKHPNSNERE